MVYSEYLWKSHSFTPGKCIASHRVLRTSSQEKLRNDKNLNTFLKNRQECSLTTPTQHYSGSPRQCHKEKRKEGRWWEERENERKKWGGGE